MHGSKMMHAMCFSIRKKKPKHKPCKELFTVYKPDNLRLMLCVKEVLPVKYTSLKKKMREV